MYTTYEPSEIRQMVTAASGAKSAAAAVPQGQPQQSNEERIFAAISQIGFFAEISLESVTNMLVDVRLTTHGKDELIPADRYDGRLCVIIDGGVMMELENEMAIELEKGHLFGDVGYFMGPGYAKDLTVTKEGTTLFSFRLSSDSPSAALNKCLSGLCAAMAEKLSWYGFC